MRDLASVPPSATAVPEPARAPLPEKLLLRAKRPFAGVAMRFYGPFALIGMALIVLPRGPVFWAFLGAAALWFALFPAVVQGLLGPIERKVLAATPKTAPGLLDALRKSSRVQLLAPFAWTAAQEGRLHLVRGDGRAAAKSLSEAIRLAGAGTEPPASVVSAIAQAHLIAEAPEQARELLGALAKRQALGPWEELHLGIALLLGGKVRADEARRHLEVARQALGGHPRVLAAEALAGQREGATEGVTEVLRAAEAALAEAPDPLAEMVLERARRLLRPALKAQEKRARKLDARAGKGEKPKEKTQGTGAKGQVAEKAQGTGAKGQAAGGRADGKAPGAGAKDKVAGAGGQGPAVVEKDRAPGTGSIGQVEPAAASAESVEPANVAGGVVLALGPAVAERKDAGPKPRGKRAEKRAERRAARRAAKAERRAGQRPSASSSTRAPTRTTGPVRVAATGGKDAPGAKDMARGAEKAAAKPSAEAVRAETGGAKDMASRAGAQPAGGAKDGAPEKISAAPIEARAEAAATIPAEAASAATTTLAPVNPVPAGMAAAPAGMAAAPAATAATAPAVTAAAATSTAAAAAATATAATAPAATAAGPAATAPAATATAPAATAATAAAPIATAPAATAAATAAAPIVTAPAATAAAPSATAAAPSATAAAPTATTPVPTAPAAAPVRESGATRDGAKVGADKAGGFASPGVSRPVTPPPPRIGAPAASPAPPSGSALFGSLGAGKSDGAPRPPSFAAPPRAGEPGPAGQVRPPTSGTSGQVTARPFAAPLAGPPGESRTSGQVGAPSVGGRPAAGVAMPPGGASAPVVARPAAPSVGAPNVGGRPAAAPPGGTSGQVTGGSVGSPSAPTPSTPSMPRVPTLPTVPAVPRAPTASPVVPAVGGPAPGGVTPPQVPAVGGPAPGVVTPPPVIGAMPPLVPPMMAPTPVAPPRVQAPSVAPPRVAAVAPAAVTAADDAEWDSLLDALDENPGPGPV